MKNKRHFDFTTVSCPHCGKKIPYKDYDDCFDIVHNFEIGDSIGYLTAYYAYSCPDCQDEDAFVIKSRWRVISEVMEYV